VTEIRSTKKKKIYNHN